MTVGTDGFYNGVVSRPSSGDGETTFWYINQYNIYMYIFLLSSWFGNLESRLQNTWIFPRMIRLFCPGRARAQVIWRARARLRPNLRIERLRKQAKKTQFPSSGRNKNKKYWFRRSRRAVLREAIYCCTNYCTTVQHCTVVASTRPPTTHEPPLTELCQSPVRGSECKSSLL